MQSLRYKNEALFTIAVIACLILVNLISLHHFFRIDLTKDGKFTLSTASRMTMKQLKDPMSITVYFTDGLPPPYSSNGRYLRDLLEEYRSASLGRFSFEFIDPAKDESEDDKAKKKEAKQDIFGRVMREQTSMEKDLNDLGIQPVEIRVIEDDQQQQKRAYMGLVIRYDGKNQVIPVIQDTANLERDLTSMMRKLVRVNMPVLALSQHIPAGVNISQLRTQIQENMTIKEVDLNGDASELLQTDALLVLGAPKVSESALKTINQFVQNGKSAAFLLDRYDISPETLQIQPHEEGNLAALFSYLSAMGVNVQKDFVADVQCVSLGVTEKRGGMSFTLPVRYPFIPEIRTLNEQNLITRGLSSFIAPFAASLTLQAPAKVKGTVLVASGQKSWIESEPFDLNPRREWRRDKIQFGGPYSLVVQLNGIFPDFYSGQVSGGEAAKDARLIVAGTSAFTWDQFFNGANQAFTLNMLDWLVADSSLLDMRIREFTDAPINPNLGDTARTFAKYLNVIGVPALLVLYGILRWRRRETKRKSVTIK